VERNFLNINKKSSTAFEKIRKEMKKYGKINNFYKLKKKIERKKQTKKNYFREICAEKVCSKINQQQNGQRQKGPQQNGPRQKDVLPD